MKIKKKKQGNLFVVSAPSGAGKTTIVELVLEKTKNIQRSVSATTRKPRKGEKNKKDYFFYSEKMFKSKVKANSFLEWENNFGQYYGTPKGKVAERLKQGCDVVLTIDVKGAMQIKKKAPKSVLVFIAPPSMSELKKRLKGRATDNNKDINKRMIVAKKEMSYMKKYDYCVVNDNLKKAVDETVSIITAKRCEI